MAAMEQITSKGFPQTLAVATATATTRTQAKCRAVAGAGGRCLLG